MQKFCSQNKLLDLFTFICFVYSRGVLRNFVDFFECTCMGLCRPMKVDWGVQFSTDLSQSGATNFVSTNNRENYQFV